MQVKISTDFGENNFQMRHEDVIELLGMAFKHAAKGKTIIPVNLDIEQMSDGYVQTHSNEEIQEEKEETVYEVNTEPIPNTVKHTRNESLFGEEWKGKSIDAAQRDYNFKTAGYRGFLYIKCPSCGKIKGFNAKTETKEHRCDCGEIIELKELKTMYPKCECGKSFKYYTNINDEQFEYNCMNCGAPIDMKINMIRNAYVTVSSSSKRYF